MSDSASSPAARTAPEPDSPVTCMIGFTHHYADVNGTRIHFVIGGEGPVVVLLHGFPYSWTAWRDIMPRLAAAGFTVLAPDLREMSDSAQAEDGFAKTNVAEDVRAIVLGLGPVRLVVADIGAMVAVAYALKHPARWHALVLGESVLPVFGLEEVIN